MAVNEINEQDIKEQIEKVPENNQKQDEQIEEPVFVHPDSKTNDFTELSSELPSLGTVDSKEEEKKEKLTKRETIKKLNDFIKANSTDGESAVWDFKFFANENNTSSSVDIKLAKNKKILKDIRVADTTKQEIRELLRNAIDIPSDSQNNILNFLQNHAYILENNSQSEYYDTLSIFVNSSNLTEETDLYVNKALNDESANWGQYINLQDGRKLSSSKVTVPSSMGSVTGNMAKIAIQSALGTSTLFNLVLPHSGIVAVILAPLPNDLINLQYTLDTAKINVGRNTGGNNYGLTTWFVNSAIVDLFLKKIYWINTENKDPEYIKSVLDPMDIPSIAWGLAAAMFPNGYDISRVGITDEGEHEILIGKVLMHDMAIYADSRLSLRQKQHLANGSNKTSSHEELLSYKRDWKNKEEVKDTEVKVFERIDTRNNNLKVETKIVLGDSTVEKYINHGNLWDVYLRDAVNETLSLEPDEQIRTNFITQKLLTTQLREYSHLIKEIKIVETIDNNSITKSITANDDIFVALEDLAINPEIRENVLKACVDYINDNQKVVYGLPTISDWEDENNSSPISNKIVPINTVTTFFTLTGLIYRQLGLAE